MSLFVSILTGGSNSHETTAEAANSTQTDLIGEGFVGTLTNTAGVAPATGAFAVNAKGSPAMAVDVSSGTAYVDATPTSQNSQTLRVRSTATEEVTIAANSSGSTKYDWIYISISAANAANPAVNADNVATLVTSRSTSISSDDGSPPTYGLLVAKVTVANGASSITNANITDSRSNITLLADLEDDVVTTDTIADGSVTDSKISTSAILLGRTSVTSNFTTTTSSNAAITGMSVTVTVPTTSRVVMLIAQIPTISVAAAAPHVGTAQIWEGTVGSGTQLASSALYIFGNGSNTNGCTIIAFATPTAGSKTYNVGLSIGSTNSKTITMSATSPGSIAAILL